jgi:DNA-binding SARP family transcriptional activator
MVDLVAIKQSEDFEWLSEQTRALVDALLANCTKVAEILERHAKKMEDLQSKTEVWLEFNNIRTTTQ